MVLGNNSVRETHYDILSVKEDASYEDIRTSYRTAILNSHPDKLQAASESGDRFLKVQKAWEILSDSRSRALYENMLIASKHDTFVADDISLEDVSAEDAGDVVQLFHQCRCGDYYFVDSSELDKMGYSLSRDGSKLSFDAQNVLPASLVLPGLQHLTPSMSMFCHEEKEEVPNPSRRSKLLAACFIEAFSNCHMTRTLRRSSTEEEDRLARDDFDDEQELIVSAIRSRAMEKLKRKPHSLSLTDSFSWVYSTKTGELYITEKAVKKKQEFEDDDDDEKEEFVSVASCFSCCSASAAASNDAFLSVKTSLSRCSSLDGFDFYFSDFEKRQSIIRQLCHCEGWPFGLCRKAMLLPPLPKSPSESWTWNKSHKGIDTKLQSSPFRSYTMKHQR